MTSEEQNDKEHLIQQMKVYLALLPRELAQDFFTENIVNFNNSTMKYYFFDGLIEILNKKCLDSSLEDVQSLFENFKSILIRHLYSNYWQIHLLRQEDDINQETIFSVLNNVSTLHIEQISIDNGVLLYHSGELSQANEIGYLGLILKKKWLLIPSTAGNINLQFEDNFIEYFYQIKIIPLYLKKALDIWGKRSLTQITSSFATIRSSQFGLREIVFQGNDVLAGISELNQSQEVNIDLKKLQPWIEIQWETKGLSCKKGIRGKTVEELEEIIGLLINWQKD